jgi:hypothetical protein
MQRTLMALGLVVLLAACGSSGVDLGSIGDILGSRGSDDSSDVRGTVVRVDTRDQRIDLNAQYVNNLRDDRSNQSIYYDSRTVVEYQNNTYSPADLEPGDQISIQGSNQSGRYIATRIIVTRNVRQ